MNYNQNHKISQITPSTLVIGVDIAKDKHVARAQDDRGYEFGKRLIFENRIEAFEVLLEWIFKLQKENAKNHVIIGAEPTGHYWMRLGYYLTSRDIDFVLVNPMHVKKSKELDDNSPTKNDTKDARVIAQLVKGWEILRTKSSQWHICGVKRRDQITRSARQTAECHRRTHSK